MPNWNKKIMSAVIAFEGELNSIVREVRNYKQLSVVNSCSRQMSLK